MSCTFIVLVRTQDMVQGEWGEAAYRMRFFRKRIFGLGIGIVRGCAGRRLVLISRLGRSRGGPRLGLKSGFKYEIC